MYLAIIGDIIHSKSLFNRSEVQLTLNSLLHQANTQYHEDIAANFLITLGDEFQGLLYSPKHLFDIIDLIKFSMYPTKIRFGIGIGTISTDINRNMALGADGPAYYNARYMVNEIKQLEKAKMATNIDTRICAPNYNHVMDLINVNLNLCAFIEANWTSKQRELIKRVNLFPNKTQREIASELNLAQSSIQRGLKSSGYYDYIKAKDTVLKILTELWEENKIE